jgi:hypothetical protein
MNYLIISGPPQTGKTPAIVNIATDLINNRAFSVIDGAFPPIPPDRDFICLVSGLDNTGRQVIILINSATDEPFFVDRLADFYHRHPSVDMIFTSSRQEGDGMRTYLFNKLQINSPANIVIEIPRGRMISGITRPATIPWYQVTMQANIFRNLAWPPFNL